MSFLVNSISNIHTCASATYTSSFDAVSSLTRPPPAYVPTTTSMTHSLTRQGFRSRVRVSVRLLSAFYLVSCVKCHVQVSCVVCRMGCFERANSFHPVSSSLSVVLLSVCMSQTQSRVLSRLTTSCAYCTLVLHVPAVPPSPRSGHMTPSDDLCPGNIWCRSVL